MGLAQSPIQLSIDTEHSLEAMPLTKWGVSISDADFTIDGGLAAEFVQNKSFEFDYPLAHWQIPLGNQNLTVIRGESSSPNNHYVKLKLENKDKIILENDGFFGMSFSTNQRYTLSFLARQLVGDVEIIIQCIGPLGDTLANNTVKKFTKEWKYYSQDFRCDSTAAHAKLRLIASGNGEIDVDVVSMLPQDAKWGWRKDLVNRLHNLNPGFIMFPGYENVISNKLKTSYDWKSTLTNNGNREMEVNVSSSNPHAYHANNIGLYEYLLLAEELEASPIPIVNIGIADNGETIEQELQGQFVDDVLDLIEFANGSPTSTWGSVRARMGHVAPFELQHLAVGGIFKTSVHFDRLRKFISIIDEQYPQLKLIISFDAARKEEFVNHISHSKSFLKKEVYATPSVLISMADSIMALQRNVAVTSYHAFYPGELDNLSVNNWGCALSEAIFLLRFQQQNNQVQFLAYSSIWNRIEDSVRKPGLMWFNNDYIVNTPSYYVHELIASNKNTHRLSITSPSINLKGEEDIYAAALWDSTANQVIIRIVNSASNSKKVIIDTNGFISKKKRVHVKSIWSPSLTDYNSVDDQYHVSPVTVIVPIRTSRFSTTVKGNSLSVITIPGN